MERSYLTIGAIIVVLVVGLARLLMVGRRPKGYPPGPPTLPLLGNIHQMPARDAHLQFEKWAREYGGFQRLPGRQSGLVDIFAGEIYSLMLGTKTLIVLSSDEAMKELLDKKSGIYSSRQEMYIGQHLCSDDLRLLMMASSLNAVVICRPLIFSQPYGPDWRRVTIHTSGA